jgi:4-hydroxy-tetrahydrodipicolinate synthase
MITPAAGAWPVVLTPFDESGAVDHAALARYTGWLITHGAAGLFAVALSGEMFELSSAERVAAAKTVVDAAADRVQVAAAALGQPDDRSGASLADEVGALTEAGVDIVVLVVSSVLTEDDNETRIDEIANVVIAQHPQTALGLYECPLPHHRLLSLNAIERLAATGSFVFFKETSHDVALMRQRVEVAEPHGLRIYNAGIENYAESLAAGVSGLSGWIVNVAPDAVATLTRRVLSDGVTPQALEMQSTLSDVEHQMGATYPSSAKAIVNERAGVGLGVASRWRPADVDPESVRALAGTLGSLSARD